MKKLITYLLITVSLITLLGCSPSAITKASKTTKQSPKKSVKQNLKPAVKKDKIVFTMSSTAEMIGSYKTLKELSEKCKYVIEGTVIDYNSYMNQGTLPVTDSKFLIEKSYTSGLKKGQTITISSVGGLLPIDDYLKYFPSKSAGPKYYDNWTLEERKSIRVKMTLEGAPIMEKNKKYLIFIGKDPKKSKDIYYVLGTSEAIFPLNNTTGDALSIKATNDSASQQLTSLNGDISFSMEDLTEALSEK